MTITLQRFIDINKYALGAAMLIYVNALFEPLYIQIGIACCAAVGAYNLLRQKRAGDILKYTPAAIIVFCLTYILNVRILQPGIIFVLGAGMFSLLHHKFLAARLYQAALLWAVPLIAACITYSKPLQQESSGNALYCFILAALVSSIPAILLLTGKAAESAPKKSRLKIVKVRTLVQTGIFMLWAWVTAIAFIKGSQTQLIFWAIFNIFTVALLPFFFGRILCGWLCPNATMQDALFKNLRYTRPIETIPKALEEQTHASAMYLSGPVDQNAPYMPATMLISWFPMFFLETIYDLTGKMWYPVAFMYGLFFLSLLLPWRKMCAEFCWLSSYRGLAGHNSLWRLRYNKSKCRKCKRCSAEAVCPYYIDIRSQDNEMPVTCCLCFSCMEACPFDDVITLKRSPEEKQRLKAL